MEQSEYYATQLWQARLSGNFCEPFQDGLSLEQAYAIQRACTDTAPSKEQVIGYKIGATSKETLILLGLEQPFFGPLYKSAFVRSNGHEEQLELALLMQHKPRVEAEFVVCMKNDIKRGNSDVIVSDIVNDIDWIAPGLEIVASRFSHTVERPGHLAIADFGANQYMIVGAQYKNWRTLDLSAHKLTLTIDEQPEIQGHSGMSIYGNPLEFVCWLLNQPGMHNTGIKAGQIISCGTCSGAPFITAGNKITADYGVLGKLSVLISAQ